MRSKRGRKAKAPGRRPKTRSTNPEAEVFVLTPNILQKLGINLENLAATDESSPTVNNELGSQNVDHGPINSTNDDSETLCPVMKSLEPKEDNSNFVTTNLIKESLLLSPSFQNESEICSKVIEEQEPNTGESLTCSRHLDFSNHLDKSEDRGLTHLQNLNEVSAALEQFRNESTDCLPFQQIMAKNELTDVNENYTHALSNDDHTDEAYLSDCSNSNLGSQEYPNTNLLPGNTISCKVQPKIEIVNEEILNSSQLREIHKLHKPHLSKCFPVSLTTLIIGKNTKENNSKDNTENNFDIRESDDTMSQMCSTALKEEFEKNSSFGLFDEKDKASTIDFTQIDDKDIIKEDNFEILKYCLDENNSKNGLTSPAELENLTSINLLNECTDFPVTDIEMHTKDKEEMLEKIAEELKSFDKDVILHKIDNSVIDNFNSLQLIEQTQKVSHVMSNNNLKELVSGTALVAKSDLVDENYLCSYSDSSASRDLKIDCTENLTHEYPLLDDNVKGFGKSGTVMNESFENVSSNNNSYLEDKAKEIAKYLKQFENKKSELLSNYTIKRNSRQKIQGKYKLRIHGVEKPGGSKGHAEEKRPHAFKTYVNRNNASRKTKGIALQSFEKHFDYVSTNIIDMDTEPNAKIKENLNSTSRFCLCEDFGKMYYYDSESLYEHIHFWEHKIIDCNEQLLFSIYNNEGCDIICKNQNSPVETVEQSCTNKESFCFESTICWNTFIDHVDAKSESKNDYIEVETTAFVKLKDNTSVNKDSELLKEQEETVLGQKKDIQELKDAEVIDENVSHSNLCNMENVEQLAAKEPSNAARKERLAELTDKQMSQKCSESLQSSNQETNTRVKSTKKRKISDVSTTDSNKTELAIKKSVKCCVCKQVLGENEWQDHIVKHNFIAWKEGTNIDLKDPGLLTNLKEKIKKEKTLSCPVCNSVYKKVKTFLTHIEQCLILGSKNTSVANNSMIENCDSLNKEAIENTLDEADEIITCGVCNDKITALKWIDHIAQKHNYIAWKSGQSSLELNEEEKLKHLSDIIKETGPLTCSICGTVRKRARHFVTHLKKCKEEAQTNTDSESVEVKKEISEVCSPDDPKKTETDQVKCGVCGVKVNCSSWYNHMGKEHEYLAWVDGDEKLDTSDEALVKNHLNAISRMYGALICGKCGLSRKYVKSYMHHAKQCTGEVVQDESLDVTLEEQNKTRDSINTYTCGVCGKQVPANDWIRHIKMWHSYMAWKDEEFLDLKDKDNVKKHLEMILQDEHLQCIKCNTEFTTVSSYQKHTKSCKNKLFYVCAVCSQQIDPTDWESHKMNKHYNVAWIAGEPPIDINNAAAVEKLIKEYKNQYNRLICKICGISRVSCMGFYAHIIVCGKSEEEAELYKKICNICNKKYLCVYENQHMTYHRERDLALEKKQRQQEEKEEEKNITTKLEEVPSGTRRAALRARSVIEKYQKDIEHDKCAKSVGHSFDSDESVHLKSEPESDDSEVDSDLSDAEEDINNKRRKYRDHKYTRPKIDRFPFKPNDVESYLDTCGKEFVNFHYKPIQVFPDWHTNEWEPVDEENLEQFTPPLEESCSVRLRNDSWYKYTRFEGKKHDHSTGLTSIFTGGCVQSIAWIPPIPDAQDEHGHYLAVIGNLDADFPKIKADEIQSRFGLIQIWDLGNFKSRPEFALGLAHDYGIAWAMDWCPNGAREKSPASDKQMSRLGLLAVAFSNGSAYIFPVMYPKSIIKDKKMMYKLKPSVELRLSMTERPTTQATSINWSLHGKLDTIVVGYCDGTTAFYDLNTKSPLLRSIENGVVIIYPYHDNRLLSTCITGVSTYPSIDENAPLSVAVSSPTGSMLLTRVNTIESVQCSSLSSADICFQSLWPSALIACEQSGSAIGYNNELEWFGSGRRLGAGKATATCERCGRAALALPPAVTIVRKHPVNDMSSKRLVALINLCPLGKKRKIKNDDLQVVVEPSNYEGAITKYGIELILDKSLNNASQERDLHPGRFPLADITSMKFCPSAAYHNRLAISTHAGIVLIITV